MDHVLQLLLVILLVDISSSNGQDVFRRSCIDCDPGKEGCFYLDDSGNAKECPQTSAKKFTISNDNISKEVANTKTSDDKTDESHKFKPKERETDTNQGPEANKIELKKRELPVKVDKPMSKDVDVDNAKYTTEEETRRRKHGNKLSQINLRSAEDEESTDQAEGTGESFMKNLKKAKGTTSGLKGAKVNIEEEKGKEKEKDQERNELSVKGRRRCPIGQIFDRKRFVCKILANLQCKIDARNRNWEQLLKTDDNGNALSGAKADLLEAAMKGSRIKIRTSTYSAEVQNCRKINQDLCCQGLLHGSYRSWEKFQDDVYWWMINVCTTGNWHMVRYFVGGKYRSQTKTRGTFMWYALRNNDGSYPEPLLSTDSSGTILSGTHRRVKRAVKDGKSLTVVQKNLFFIPIQNVQLQQRTVSAQHVWSVSQRIVGDHIEFQSNAYWWFNQLTNLGSRDMSRWSLGFHTSRSQTNDVVAMDWFAGDCWIKAFTTSVISSQPLARLYLRSRVESGLPIRVKVGNIYREVDNVMVSGTHVSAQIISQLTRNDVDTFVADLNWEFSTLSTRGVVRTYRPLVGSSTMAAEGTTKISQDITWYVDSRRWDLMFHISDTGTTISGSAVSVRNAVEQGADIRIGYRQAGEPGFRYSSADNINFGPSPHLSVQVMRHLRDNNIPGDEFDFGNNLVWSFLLLNTKGYIRKTDWIVGEHVNAGRSIEPAEIKFFVNF